MAEGLRWEDIRGCRVRVPDHVVRRVFSAETVLLNVRTGQYHGLEEIGSRFFAVVAEAPDLAAASAVLRAEFEQPAERIDLDLAAFCTDLLECDLIELERIPA